MTVVGAGITGVEYSSMFGALGTKVTLVDQRDRPVEFLDREIQEQLFHQMRNRNVTLRLGEAVEEVQFSLGALRHAVILLELGKCIVSDLVPSAIGRLGATDGFNLEAVGIRSDARGRIRLIAI